MSLEKSIISDNGVPIYVYPGKHLHSFCLCLYIRAGSMYEPDELNGATHLWEHLLFRKMNRICQGDFYKRLDRLGLSFFAYTYKEFVMIKVTGATKHFQEAAQIIAMVFEPGNLALRDVNLEKRRVKAEKREDGEEFSLDCFTQRIIWENTSLANTIAGKNKVIDRLGVKALGNVHDNICSAGNLFFYITGCFNDGDVSLLKRLVAKYSFMENGIRENLAPVPARFFKREGQVEVKNSQHNFIRFSFDVDTSRFTYAELDLLYDILFCGENSKVFMELSENTGYIYDFDARLERYSNIGNLYFSFEIEKKNIFPSIQKVVEVIRDVKTNITDELSYVLPVYLDNAEMDLDDAEALNWNMAYECHIMQNTYKSIEEKKKAYQRVTPMRIMDVAKEVFTPDNVILTLKTNKKAFDFETARSFIKSL